MRDSSVLGVCIRAIRALRLTLLFLLLPLAAQAQYTCQTNYGTLTITGYTGADSALSIPSNLNGYAVTSIGYSAFLGNSNLTSVIIPDGVTSIGNFAFMNCVNLLSVTIPGSVTNLGSWTFEMCLSLTDVTLPPVSSLGQQVFALCSSLTNITIPASVTNIGNWAFAPCTNLANIYFLGNAPSLGAGVFNSVASNATVFYLAETTGWTNQWDGLLTVPWDTIPFTYTTNNDTITITSYTGSNSVVTIPGTINGLPVTTIGDYAFLSSPLTGISLPDGVTSLGLAAFYGCNGLASITLPASIATLGANAFSGCVNLTSVFFQGDAPGDGTDTSVFLADTNATAYYLAQTSGWQSTFDGLPTAPVGQSADLQALGLSWTQPFGDPRGQHPAALSVFLKNNGPGTWNWNGCLVAAYLAAPGAPQSAWLALGGAVFYPQIGNGQTVTNALEDAALSRFALPLYLPGGAYTVWLESTPQSDAPQDTDTNNNWAAGNTLFVPTYAPAGLFNFFNWLGQLWTSGSANGIGGAATFNGAYSVTADNFGNYYIADAFNHTIRRATSGGVVTVLAGMAGRPGSADGTGSAARFNTPMGVAVDGSGNVYVADRANNAIRKITPMGVVSTLAGWAGGSGSVDGTGSVARFAAPFAVAADSTGMVYVADTWNHTIRKITPAGAVTTLAGLAQKTGSTDATGGSARFLFPQGIAISPNGLVYVSDTGNHTIRQITQAGVVTTLAGLAGAAGSADGTGSGARFNTPTGITADRGSYLYVADSGNQTLRGLNLNGVAITVGGAAGKKGQANGIGAAARFDGPYSLVVDRNGNMIVADTYNGLIRVGALINTATVHVAVSPANTGSVTGGGRYVMGTNVTLAAFAYTGWVFSHWNDGVVFSQRTVTIPTADTWYTASFVPVLGVAADAPALDWSTGGASAWNGELAVSHDNFAAVQSGALGAGQTNWTQTSVAHGPGSLSFWWQLSAAEGDTLQCYINTQLVAQLSGAAPWSQFVTFLGSTNAYTLTWVFIKNNPAGSGANAGWLDQVSWSPCPYAEHVPQVFYQDPQGQLASWVLSATGELRFARLLANTGGWALKAAGDIDGDGVSDLLFETAGGDTAVWFMNADGSTRSAQAWPNIGGWELKACGDYEGSGNGQAFFQTARGDTAYWQLDTNGNAMACVSLGNLGGWKLRGIGDLDGDHKAELFWQDATGALAIWYHNPDGTIRGSLSYNTGGWLLCGVADLDGDGVSDLLWQDGAGNIGDWFMNSNGTFRAASQRGNTGGWKLKAAGR